MNNNLRHNGRIVTLEYNNYSLSNRKMRKSEMTEKHVIKTDKNGKEYIINTDNQFAYIAYETIK